MSLVVTIVSRYPFAIEGFSVPANWLLAELGAFILAEVFASGLQLREDVEGTI
jgi:hypothetical protein